MNILIADDSSSIRNLVRKFLEMEFPKANFFEAADGLEALEHHQAADLIVMDLGMPYMDGMAFVEKVRETDRKKPVLILSGQADPKTIRKLLDAGADDYLAKPFKSEILRDKVRQLMR